MNRIRITLLLVGVGLVVPVAILVSRALDGLAFESALRHRTIADRAFDEMERTLSEFLRSEEERPVGQYGFYDSDAPGGAGPTRSPLSRLSSMPFIVGHFQIDPNGTIHTPLRPRSIEGARRAGDWPPPPEVEARISRTEALARAFWRANEEPRSEKPAGLASAQAPGSTLEVGARLQQSSADRPALRELREGFTAYDAIQGFNLALEDRAERKRKVTEAPAAAVYGAILPNALALAAEAEAPEGLVMAEQQERDSPLRALGRLQATASTRRMPEAARKRPPSKVRIVLDPMVGRSLGDHLLLYRTVVIGEQGFRQGLVVDVPALAEWLQARVIAPSGLASVASVEFPSSESGAISPESPELRTYQHRFAEPFDVLTARLRLATLPGVGSTMPVYILAALVIVVGAIGLVALYRMVAVAMHFAERRTNFVAAVSHELKTPLTAIRMHAEMLRDGMVGSAEKRDEYYRVISDESERLSRLIQNVLEFSRVEKAEGKFQTVVGAIAPILEEAIEKLQPHAERDGFELRLVVEPGLPAVRLDGDAMVQVLFNLVENALKYARTAQRKEVHIEARRSGDRVVVGVRDFGPGVPNRSLKRVFEPFYRAEQELTRSTRGTGIGLALVRELGERMGAAVRGVNPADGGFLVELSFAPAPVEEP